MSGVYGLALLFVSWIPAAYIPAAFSADEPCIESLTGPSFSGDQWDRHLGTVWEQILRAQSIPRKGVVIEVAPGEKPKIGYALKNLGFVGTLYVVEPHAPALAKIVALYSELLPLATVVPVAQTLAEFASAPPQELKQGAPDALVANHPLDDFIAAAAVEKGSRYFSTMYEAQEAELTQGVWNRLARNPELSTRAREQTFNEWKVALENLRPQFVALSQYPSTVQKQLTLTHPHELAMGVLSRLRGEFGEIQSPHFAQRLSSFGQNPTHWWLSRPRRNFAEVLHSEPAAIRALGRRVFAQQTAQRLKPEAYALIYWNSDLAQRLGLSPDGESHAARELVSRLALDLTPPPSAVARDSAPVQVWVDRQKDPQGIAMSGNRGSGRAAYVGEFFNVKGIGRTQFARAPVESGHGSGRMALSAAIWEALVSDAVSRDLSASTAEVLAILHLNRSSGRVTERGAEVSLPVALEIRVDRGALDRPVHVHERAKSVGPVDLRAVARSYAMQDAERWATRWLHGAWSAGNISLSGHFIDLDMATAVEGRAPVYSYSAWYPHNLFGKESLGLREVLLGLARSQQLSAGAERELLDYFDHEREGFLARRFLQTLGYSARAAEKLSVHTAEAVKVGLKITQDLGALFVFDPQALQSWKGDLADPSLYFLSQALQVRALSRLAGLAPELRAQWMEKAAQFHRLPHPFAEGRKREALPEGISQQTLAELMADHAMTTSERWERASQSLRDWIQAIEKIDAQAQDLGLLDGSEGDREVWNRALFRNTSRPLLQDAYGMDAAHTLADGLASGGLTASQVMTELTEWIDANRPRPERMDVRPFVEGRWWRALTRDVQGRPAFEIHVERRARSRRGGMASHLERGGKSYPLVQLSPGHWSTAPIAIETWINELTGGSRDEPSDATWKLSVAAAGNNRTIHWRWSERTSHSPRKGWALEVE